MLQFFVVWGKCCFMWSQRVDIRVTLDSDADVPNLTTTNMMHSKFMMVRFHEADGWMDLGATSAQSAERSGRLLTEVTEVFVVLETFGTFNAIMTCCVVHTI